MSSSLSIHSEDDSLTYNKNNIEFKLHTSEKKKNNFQYSKKKKFISDSKKDLMDLGITSKIKSKTNINQNQKPFNDNKMNITNSKLSIFTEDEMKKKFNFDNKNIGKKIDSNLNLNINEYENKENDHFNKENLKFLKPESTKSDFYKIKSIDKLKNNIFGKTITSFFPSNQNENNIIKPERIESFKNQNFKKENFKKINNLKNIINNAYTKTFIHSRNGTIKHIKTNELVEFSEINNEKILITNRNFYTKFPSFSRTNISKKQKNSNISISKNIDKKEIYKDESDLLSENFNYRQEKDWLVHSIRPNSKENQSRFYDSNTKLNPTKNSDHGNENKAKFSTKKSYFEYKESDSDKEYDKELIKNKRDIIKRTNTIKKIISKPETFDVILYKNQQNYNKIEKKNSKNLKLKIYNNMVDPFKNNTDEINHIYNPKSNYNSKKNLFENSKKNTPKDREEIKFSKNIYDNLNDKIKKKIDNNKLYENRDMYIKENITVNSSDLSNSEFNKKTQMIIEENKNANRNIVGSSSKSNRTSSYISFKIPSVRDLNSRNSKKTYNKENINFKDNNYYNKTNLDAIKENSNINNIFSENEIKKLKYIREKLVTPIKYRNENMNDFNPYNFIRSISNIENKTNKIAKLYNKNLKNYKNPINLVKNVEDEQNIHLKIPKISKKLRNKVFMVSSSFEEHRKNFTHLSENKRNLLEIVDFVNSMDDETALKLKENLLQLYKNSEKKNGLIELSEIMKEKMKIIFKREKELNDIILKNKQMKNDVLKTSREIKNKYFKNDKKYKSKNK
jgi:hypothetical protein